MKRLLLAILLLPMTAFGQEEAPEDPLAGLPAALRPGAKASFSQGPTENRLKGKLNYDATAPGERESGVIHRPVLSVLRTCASSSPAAFRQA